MKLSRREFVTSGATAMTAAAVGLRPARALAQTPKKGGTLRVGFYIEAATMDPISRAARSIGRSITTSTSRW